MVENLGVRDVQFEELVSLDADTIRSLRSVIHNPLPQSSKWCLVEMLCFSDYMDIAPYTVLYFYSNGLAGSRETHPTLKMGNTTLERSKMAFSLLPRRYRMLVAHKRSYL